MKKATYILLLFPLLFLSCEIEMSDNGKLDGNWQLQTIDTLSTGGVCDMTRSCIYWGIENHLLQVKNTEKGEKILFRFEQEKDMLTIHSPHVIKSQYETVPVEDENLLFPFGINSTEETFVMEHISNSKMVLSSELLRLHFRKY